MDPLFSDMSREDWEFAVLSCLLVASISLYLAIRNWKRSRIIEDTPTTKLRSAHQGYVEVSGKGQFIDDQAIYAPLSNHPCLWYHSQIEQEESVIENNRKQSRWRIVYNRTSDYRFKLMDADSSCYVDPAHAEVNGSEHLAWYGNTEWPTKTLLLESQSLIHGFSNHYRYSESLILPGQSLYILGQFTTVSASTQHKERAIMIDLLNEWKKDQADLQRRFDSNRDGVINQPEWEVARQQARLEAQQIHAQLVLEPDVNIIAKPEKSGYPFIISVYPQKQLSQKYQRNTLIALTVLLLSVGGLLLLAFHKP
ncbi:E3 Ubiquitin ligase [Nitrosomonas sp. PY1]|uniref:GIDE domain-containing protein n=1 Tax=Nitrosomonas sp. PY1 TaxID=1803906 RepID=UPI001FC86705|nr:GIDE domain-containing protein [Nitrosomonas sp. PY1]GKS68032.1 E3 Ubiquitin ligase [Nitrosomonas sp. PY1]